MRFPSFHGVSIVPWGVQESVHVRASILYQLDDPLSLLVG